MVEYPRLNHGVVRYIPCQRIRGYRAKQSAAKAHVATSGPVPTTVAAGLYLRRIAALVIVIVAPYMTNPRPCSIGEDHHIAL